MTDLTAEQLKEALGKLDVENAEHWTADGAPRVDAVASLLGVQGLTRKHITDIAPDFNRTKAAEKPLEPEKKDGEDGAQTQQDGEGETEVEESELEQEVREAWEALEAAEAALNEAKAAQAAAAKAYHAALEAAEAAKGPDDGMAAIQAFIKARHNIRAEKVMRTTTTSPIDEAMARRPARGTARPVRPLMNNPDRTQ